MLVGVSRVCFMACFSCVCLKVEELKVEVCAYSAHIKIWVPILFWKVQC